MSRFTLYRAASTLLVTAALLAPGAARATGAHASAVHGPRHVLATAPASLGGYWHRLVSLLSPEGCAIDPHGICAASPAAAVPAGPKATLDEGCGIDPHGACSSVH